jgi:PAS domain S-box-containing protein
MNWHFTPPAAPLIVGAVLMLVIAEIVRRRGAMRGGREFRLLCLGTCVYVVGYALELGASDPADVMRWLKVEYFGVAMLPGLALVTALSFTGRSRYLTPLSVALLFVIPAITWLLVLTNESHQLIWRSIDLDTSLGFTRTTFRRGPWYTVHNNFYIQVVLILTLVVLWQGWRAATGLFRRQLTVLIVAVVIPVLVHAVYLSTPLFHGLDPNPYALLLTATTLAWGMLESALLDLVPEAQERVFASLADPIVVSDDRGRVVALNPAAESALGVAAATAIGRFVFDVLPAVARLTEGHPLEEAFRTSFSLGAEGSERHFEARVTPLSPRRGQVAGRLVVLQDVTERREVERLREDLVNTLVHDLRNPLTVVRASTDLLSIDESVGQRVHELIEPARLATRRLLDLVSRLLEVHTLQSGRLPLERSRVEMGALIGEAIEMQAPLARGKDQRLLVDVESGLPPLFVDRELVGRVLQNLIGNAIKFTGPGEIRIAARAIPGPALQVSVHDDGPGIPPDIQARLFREFARGKQSGRGTGLGLAFCHSAITAHGGSIVADGDPGRGTTLAFRLPTTPPS